MLNSSFKIKILPIGLLTPMGNLNFIGNSFMWITLGSWNSLNEEKLQRQSFLKVRTHSVQRSTFKVLLLGAGFSGKSTTSFQAQTLFHQYINQNNKMDLEKVNAMKVRFNCFHLIKDIIDNDPNHSKESLELLETVQKFNMGSFNNEKVDFSTLFDTIIQYVSSEEGKLAYDLYKKSPNYYDGSERFMDPEILKKIQKKEYVVDHNDFLSTRIKTTGIVSFRFLYENKIEFQITDVGGQRSERRKWVNAFKETNCVVYIISLSEYDEINYEDEKTNRMLESISVFENTIHGEWFQDIPFIVFWNKRDVLEHKLKYSPLSNIFPEYDGGEDAEKAFDFIKQTYLSKAKRDISKFRHVIGNAFDMKIIETIFDEIKHIANV